MDEDFLFSTALPTLDHMWLELLSLQGISQSLCNSPPPLCSLLGVWVPAWSLVFPSYLILCVSFFTTLIEKSLPISSMFSVRIGPHMDVYLCVYGAGDISILLLCHFDHLSGGFYYCWLCFYYWLCVCSNLRDRMFLGICPFLVGCPFYWYTIVHNNRLWSFVLLQCWL